MGRFGRRWGDSLEAGTGTRLLQFLLISRAGKCIGEVNSELDGRVTDPPYAIDPMQSYPSNRRLEPPEIC